jgi:poly[(R)-3-hydroxyalkanoate] polymerase subunit PhaC
LTQSGHRSYQSAATPERQALLSRAGCFYLRNTYLENNLITPGKLSLLGQPIDLRRIRQDIYAVGAEKDHIVPWRSAWRIAQLTSAQTQFVLAASGHIAGMINPPSKGKGGY